MNSCKDQLKTIETKSDDDGDDNNNNNNKNDNDFDKDGDDDDDNDGQGNKRTKKKGARDGPAQCITTNRGSGVDVDYVWGKNKA